jgi:hypothetical protein
MGSREVLFNVLNQKAFAGSVGLYRSQPEMHHMVLPSQEYAEVWSYVPCDSKDGFKVPELLLS